MVDHLRLSPGGSDGNEHRSHPGVHTLPGGHRSVHPMQREDEQDGGDEVGQLHYCVHEGSVRFGCRSALNIFSIRSVIRKPLTMSVSEATRALAPTTRLPVG